MFTKLQQFFQRNMEIAVNPPIIQVNPITMDIQENILEYIDKIETLLSMPRLSRARKDLIQSYLYEIKSQLNGYYDSKT